MSLLQHVPCRDDAEVVFELREKVAELEAEVQESADTIALLAKSKVEAIAAITTKRESARQAQTDCKHEYTEEGWFKPDNAAIPPYAIKLCVECGEVLGQVERSETPQRTPTKETTVVDWDPECQHERGICVNECVGDRICNACGREWRGGPECPSCYAEDSTVTAPELSRPACREGDK